MITRTHRTRESSFGPTVLTAVLLVLAGVGIGTWYTSRTQAVPAPASQIEAPLVSIFSAPGCYIPLGLVAALTMIAVALGLYYGKQRLDAQVRVWRARAAVEETEVERQRVELDNLTPGPDGQEIARVMRIGDRLVLVKPGVVTSPVTILAPEAAVRPDQTADQLALAAILSSALGRMGGTSLVPRGGRGDSPLDGLALLMATRGLGPGWGERRIPDSIRVMTEEEAAQLESGEEG
jgi:hypothetical protein